MELRHFYEEIKDCQKCPLAGSRTQIVFGEGRSDAEVLFVGEAPGLHEDQQGRPFVGAAGRLLTELLQSIGLSREEVYIANVLKCRPPDNRNPAPDEIESCMPHLRKQIELIHPKVVCTLGNFATQVLLGKRVGITKVRGQHFQVGSFIVFPALHPAAALHQGGMIQALREDFQNLKKFLDLKLEPEPQPEQMELL
ncbi:MAG: uracil-DNA glycosylase [Nitrospiria bacterium]